MKFLFFALPVSMAVLLSACGSDDNKKPPKANTPPTAMSATVSTQADTPLTGKLMGSDSDSDKDKLSFAVSAQPTQGVLMVQTDGSYTYTPNPDVVGMDQFSFTVSDGKNTSATAMVNITIDLLAVNMGAYTRKAFNQMESDTPLSLNSRIVTQDVTDETAFDDVLAQ